jgi:hypothetical protein
MKHFCALFSGLAFLHFSDAGRWKWALLSLITATAWCLVLDYIGKDKP